MNHRDPSASEPTDAGEGAVDSKPAATSGAGAAAPAVPGSAPTAAPAPAQPSAAPRVRSPWYENWRRLRRNRMAVVCGGFAGFMVLACVFGPGLAHALAGLDATTQRTELGVSAPSWSHWLGTDSLGRDMLVRTLEGGRKALSVGLIATLVAVFIGVSWGAIAGFAGGRIDLIMMRIVDILYGFPTLAFVIVIQASIDTENIRVLGVHLPEDLLLFVLIGAISWLNMARIVRSQVIGLRHREFVEAARALGVPSGRILFRHILPNVIGVIIVYATLSLPHVMLAEAFLSYIGLGIEPPAASWGTLVTDGVSQVLAYPWLLLGPGLAMSLTIFSLNFFGDGLRDAFDPRALKG